MIFRHFLTSSNESNAFVLGCDAKRDAILIDVGDFEPAIAEFIERHGLKLAHVFITHDHYDHTGGAMDAVDRYNAELLSGTGRVGGVKARKVRHGDTVRVGAIEGKVLAVPGHTADSLCLAFPGLVFTGDALFAGSIGGTTSSSQADQLKNGIRQHIFSLPDDTEIHPGHGPSSTVAIEQRYNPFFS